MCVCVCVRVRVCVCVCVLHVTCRTQARGLITPEINSIGGLMPATIEVYTCVTCALYCVYICKRSIPEILSCFLFQHSMNILPDYSCPSRIALHTHIHILTLTDSSSETDGRLCHWSRW